VDTADRDRIDEARKELHKIIDDREMKDAVVLVFANKQDLKGALSAEEVPEKLGLNRLRGRNWLVMRPLCCHLLMVILASCSRCCWLYLFHAAIAVGDVSFVLPLLMVMPPSCLCCAFSGGMGWLWLVLLLHLRLMLLLPIVDVAVLPVVGCCWCFCCWCLMLVLMLLLVLCWCCAFSCRCCCYCYCRSGAFSLIASLQWTRVWHFGSSAIVDVIVLFWILALSFLCHHCWSPLFFHIDTVLPSPSLCTAISHHWSGTANLAWPQSAMGSTKA